MIAKVFNRLSVAGLCATLVGNGLGVAILPGNFVHKGSRARFVPLTGEAPVWETVIVTPASHSAAASVLLDMVAPRSRLQPV